MTSIRERRYLASPYAECPWGHTRTRPVVRALPRPPRVTVSGVDRPTLGADERRAATPLRALASRRHAPAANPAPRHPTVVPARSPARAGALSRVRPES